MNIYEVLFLVFAGCSFLLSGYFFFKKKGDKVANRILGIYLLLFTYNIFYNVIFWARDAYMITYIGIFGTVTIAWTLYPTLIYLYVSRVVEGKKLKMKDLIHFLPLLIVVTLFIRFYLLDINERIHVLKTGALGDYIFIANYNAFFIIGTMLFYTGLTYFKFKKSVRLTTNTKKWLQWLIGLFASYVFLMAFYHILTTLFELSKEYDYFIVALIIFLVSSIAYFAIWQPDIFNGLPVNKILPFVKYKKTGLSKELSKEFKDKLIRLIEKEKPYLNSELRLDDLAKMLNLSRHQLSQVINENFHLSFFDFINQYRISEAKKMIQFDKEKKITEIIYTCGFNNKVSFYKVFKKQLGKTPSEYRKEFAE